MINQDTSFFILATVLKIPREFLQTILLVERVPLET